MFRRKRQDGATDSVLAQGLEVEELEETSDGTPRLRGRTTGADARDNGEKA
jgi:hypothetical protein